MPGKRTKSRSRQELDISNMGSVQNTVDDLRERAKDQLQYAIRSFESTKSRIDKYIKTNPGKALMIAAAVGVAVGAVSSSFFGSNNKSRNHR